MDETKEASGEVVSAGTDTGSVAPAAVEAEVASLTSADSVETPLMQTERTVESMKSTETHTTDIVPEAESQHSDTPSASSPSTDSTPTLSTTTATPSALTLDEMLARLSPSELKALFLKYLGRIGAKGRAKQKDDLRKKKEAIIAHVGVHGRITHKETMQLIHVAKTTATRILQALEKDGRLVQHGGYKAHDAYYTIRL